MKAYSVDLHERVLAALERVPTLALRLDPMLTQINSLLDDDTIFPALSNVARMASFCRRVCSS